MGVPKFYRWVSERYPCLSEVVKEHQIPEFDNLYLDMNGIIHQCSHPNDEDVHFRIAEEKIFADIFHYLEVLFRIIRPRKVFFMAVDGVAPRAKMNQQRGRRFRAAKEAEDKIKKAIEKGEVLPSEARFDSNCITPGTAFMARLHEHLKYFVNKKISTDKTWQQVCVYFSGHETPGEGEHKIMEFIRSEKAKPNYNPDTRHCLYGLDADLIMLGLTTHETHFSLLREEVRFGGKKNQKRTLAPEETTFHLLHLSLMRQYIDYEFSSLRDKISFTYDVERIIDDWILMGFLVGNDFIPHLPHLHINHDALPLLYKTYIGILPQLGGYINESGNLNLVRFQKYLAKLADFDREQFNEVFVDLKWFESKVGNKYLNEAAGKAAEESRRCKNQKLKAHEDMFLAALDKSEEQPNSSKILQEEDLEDDDLFETEFRQYKRSYYMTKMGVEVVSDEFLADQARCYGMAIQWILHYYYHGVQSWSWYYPYHYAPYLSDIRNICKFNFQFDLGKPFLPFEQLLAVLPTLSKELLPLSYQNLMLSENSPIIEYYPTDFKTDLNGKQQEWEAVVLIPFIDEKRLLLAMEPGNKSLTEEEKQRNQHSECLKYWYDSDVDFSYLSPCPEKFPSINRCQARCKIILLDAWHVDIINNKLTKAHQSSLYFYGFPSLIHIEHKFYMKKNGVQVFQQSSRSESMILEILSDDNSDEYQSIENVASAVLGNSVFVNWPHLEEARVVAVSDGEIKFYLEDLPGNQKLYVGNSAPPTKVACVGEKEQSVWVKEVQGIVEHYQRRKGIIINETSILLYAQLLTGHRYLLKENGQVHLEKQWSKQVLPFALQVVVQDLCTFDRCSVLFKNLEDLFSPQTLVFMLGIPYYGCMGEVEDSSDVIGESRIRVLFSIPCEPIFDALIQNQHKYSIKYNPGYVLANHLGVSGYVVSRFTGSIFIGRGSKKNPHGEFKNNIGLNLKFNKKNEEVPGYTKKIGNEWLYSSAVELILGEYLERFPELFRYVSKNSQDDVFYEDDVWHEEDENGAEKVQEICVWLKSHPVSNLSRSSCDLQILDGAVIEKIEEEIEKCKIRKNKQKVRVTVKPHLLFRPLEQHHGIVPDRDAEYRLFDRVVNVRDGFSVPIGLRGTVIGIKGAERETDVLYEVLFDEEFSGGLTIRCSQARCYRLPAYALINITHGIRTECGGQKLTAIVKPQPTPNHYVPYSNSWMEGMQKKHLGGINHSPCSPFIPTRDKHDDEFCSVWQSLQDNGKHLHAHQNVQNKFITLPSEKNLSSIAQFQKPCYSECSPKSRTKKTEHLKKLKEESKFPKNVNQAHKMSEKHDVSYFPKSNIRLLKRNENLTTGESQEGLCLGSTTEKPCTEFEKVISSLKISTENEVKCPQSKDNIGSEEDHLSPQSFALKGTLMLKEILKIDGSETGERRNEKPLIVDSGRRDSHVPFSQRRQTKKMAAHMGKPQVLSGMQSFEAIGQPLITQKPVALTPVVELSRICSLVGMPKPEFSFLRLTQAMTVCQISLSNGLFIHGPQCHSENEAKEKAALFALHRLRSIGMNYPVSPLIQNVQTMGAALPPGAAAYSFPQSAPSIMSPSPQIFGSVPLQSPVHHSRKTFSQGSYHANVPPSVPPTVGTYNPFIPLQATKKSAAHKKNLELNKLKISSQAASSKSNQPEALDVTKPTDSDSAPTPVRSTQVDKHSPSLQDTAQPQSSAVTRGKTRLSSSKRKPRKLAVNFSGAKPVE